MTDVIEHTHATVRSPNGVVELALHEITRGALAGYAPYEPNSLAFTVHYEGMPAITPSRLGLTFDGNPPLAHHFEVTTSECDSHDDTWTPVYGERETIKDAYEAVQLTLQETVPPERTLVVEGRAYDAGVAMRYVIPENGNPGPVVVSDELTEFSLPSGCEGYHHVAESPYERRSIEAIGADTGGSERPLTVAYPDGRFAAITEAANETHGRMQLVGTDEDRLLVSVDGQRHTALPYATPWRVVIVGDQPGMLLERNDLVRNLAPPCRLSKTDWIEPGKVIREVTLTTAGGKRCVDFAAANGIEYVLFDGGWYGHPYDAATNADGATPWPWKVGDDAVDPNRLDLPAVIEYATDRDIGIWLYLDKRILERRLETLLPIFADWGIAGLKFGFVRVGSAGWTSWLHGAVELCAEHELMVNIHDEYRPTGLSRTYPNLLTQEGIRGNEHHPTARHNVVLPFTRFVAGAADYTVCVREDRTQPTPAHQAALAVVYYSPLQHLYWYAEPDNVEGLPEVAFFADVPTTWDETRVIEGAIGEYVTIARRSDADWYVGSITAEPRKVRVPLTMLEEGRFRLTQYADDGNGAIEVSEQTVTASETLQFELVAGGGTALRLTPLSE